MVDKINPLDKPQYLSKSKYLKGVQCPKRLYLSIFHKDLQSTPDENQEALFRQGNLVGKWSKVRFPNGKDATPEDNNDFANSIKKTSSWIEEGIQTIYEASFSYDGVYSALDILTILDGQLSAIEVKSSTEVKDYHIDDAALQFWVMSHAGFTPNKFILMHINNKYVREGELDAEELFHLEDITDLVLLKQDEVSLKIKEQKQVLIADSIPKINIGKHCHKPFDCDFKAHCWQDIPDNSVFEVSRIGAKAWQFIEKGVISIKDIPDGNPFSVRQQIQIDGVKNNQSHLDKESIHSFLGDWTFPLYFFDFETIGPAIPIYNGTSPFKQYAVQYSLHVKDTPESTIKHLEYLPKFNEDPRVELIKRMIQDLGCDGSIVTYNMGFEKGKIKQLATDFPQYNEQLMAIHDRIVDLMIPFSRTWFYTPEMNGSASIKTVLPALCKDDPDLNYNSLSISNGGDASNKLQELAEGLIDEKDKEELREALKAYCKLDTLAMVKIWEVLQQQIRKEDG